MNISYNDEAKIILNIIQNEFGQDFIPNDRNEPGYIIDGKKAIVWMKENNIKGWKELEWPNYFLKNFLYFSLKDHFQLIRDIKFLFLKANFAWDIQIHSTPAPSKISLMDKKNLDTFIQKQNGYGLIVINIHPNYDLNGEFREWHIQYGGGKSKYIQKRETEGAFKRHQKTHIFLIDILAFFFIDLKSFQQGYGFWLEDWGDDLRNANNLDRNPKYRIDLEELKKTQYLLEYIPLNRDINENDNDFAQNDDEE
jgi:hypothetical protein